MDYEYLFYINYIDFYLIILDVELHYCYINLYNTSTFSNCNKCLSIESKLNSYVYNLYKFFTECYIIFFLLLIFTGFFNQVCMLISFIKNFLKYLSVIYLYIWLSFLEKNIWLSTELKNFFTILFLTIIILCRLPIYHINDFFAK